MNTAHGHFNSHDAAASKFGRRITYGGVAASIVVGLASEDTSENALMDVALDKLRLKVPVVEGDTLYSATEVLACEPSDREDTGLVTFRHHGYNQRDEFVCQVERNVLIRRRPTRSWYLPCLRSEEGRVGKECVRTSRSRGSPKH